MSERDLYLKFGSGLYYNTDDLDPDVELIHRRRRQILLHSIVYYVYNDNLIPDYRFDNWCNQLAELQVEKPECAANVWYMQVPYSGFIGTASCHALPLDDPDMLRKAQKLMVDHDMRIVIN
jgi:hypothetical protein